MTFFITLRWYGRNRVPFRNRRVDRTKLNILNEKPYLLLLKLLFEIKKHKFKCIILERNHGQLLRSTSIFKKIHRKIALVFHYFALIEKSVSQLFCTGDVENINQAIEIYEKYDKKIL